MTKFDKMMRQIWTVPLVSGRKKRHNNLCPTYFYFKILFSYFDFNQKFNLPFHFVS